MKLSEVRPGQKFIFDGLLYMRVKQSDCLEVKGNKRSWTPGEVKKFLYITLPGTTLCGTINDEDVDLVEDYG